VDLPEIAHEIDGHEEILPRRLPEAAASTPSSKRTPMFWVSYALLHCLNTLRKSFNNLPREGSDCSICSRSIAVTISSADSMPPGGKLCQQIV
jgi:hypothetical protein